MSFVGLKYFTTGGITPHILFNVNLHEVAIWRENTVE